MKKNVQTTGLVPAGAGDASAGRFNGLARNYATSEVHSDSPTLRRLRGMFPRVDTVCDVASGAGHTGLGFGGVASRIVAVDPAPNMLAEVRRLAEDRGIQVETVQAFAESIPLPDATFDLVVCRLAAHHFTDLPKAMAEMVRLAKPGGHVAIIDMEGEEDAELDALNHAIEVLRDPTHVRTYTEREWRALLASAGLAIQVCDTGCRELPGGLTVRRWCELGGSGEAVLQAIEALLAAAPPGTLQAMGVSRDADGGYRLPVRTLLLVGAKP